MLRRVSAAQTSFSRKEKDVSVSPILPLTSKASEDKLGKFYTTVWPRSIKVMRVRRNYCSYRLGLLFLLMSAIIYLINIRIGALQDAGNVSVWPSTLSEAKKYKLSPLKPIDRDYYTVRINTWHRNEQLIASIDHHSQCLGVAQIQVVWCDKENDPPDDVVNHFSGKVVVERHEKNSLNERFNILIPPPTIGILSIDDDIIRPCFSIDSGFYRWVESPERMVGFDTRVHQINDQTKKWSYGYLSTSTQRNEVRRSFSFLKQRSYFVFYEFNLPN